MIGGDSAGEASFSTVLSPCSNFFSSFPVIRDMNRDVLTHYTGANLSLGILSHILHPHPSGTIPPITLSAPLKGAIFLSPWFSFSTTDASFYANQHRDYVSDYIGNLWSANFLGGKPRDEYNEPITAAQEWWEEGVDGKGLKDIVERPFVVGGGVEVLLDSIKAVGARLQVGFIIILSFP